jgi:hypothetical protein
MPERIQTITKEDSILILNTFSAHTDQAELRLCLVANKILGGKVQLSTEMSEMMLDLLFRLEIILRILFFSLEQTPE